MKIFQANLLIVLAFGLCGLCAWQWYEQTVQRNEITTLNSMVFDRNAAIQGYTNSIATLNHQVTEMDAHITDLKTVVTTNEQTITSQKAEIVRGQLANASLTNEVAQYKSVVNTLESKLKEVYAGVEKQNDAITNLVAQRDELAQKYDDEVKDRNDVVAKYNDLAKQIEKTQGANNSQ